MNTENPILNSPYDAPLLHYATDADGSLNYQDIRQGRRIFTADIQVMPTRENRWLPAVNSVKDKYQYPEWHFIEIANDIRNIKNQLSDKIDSI